MATRHLIASDKVTKSTFRKLDAKFRQQLTHALSVPLSNLGYNNLYQIAHQYSFHGHKGINHLWDCFFSVMAKPLTTIHLPILNSFCKISKEALFGIDKIGERNSRSFLLAEEGIMLILKGDPLLIKWVSDHLNHFRRSKPINTHLDHIFNPFVCKYSFIPCANSIQKFLTHIAGDQPTFYSIYASRIPMLLHNVSDIPEQEIPLIFMKTLASAVIHYTPGNFVSQETKDYHHLANKLWKRIEPNIGFYVKCLDPDCLLPLGTAILSYDYNQAYPIQNTRLKTLWDKMMTVITPIQSQNLLDRWCVDPHEGIEIWETLEKGARLNSFNWKQLEQKGQSAVSSVTQLVLIAYKKSLKVPLTLLRELVLWQMHESDNLGNLFSAYLAAGHKLDAQIYPRRRKRRVTVKDIIPEAVYQLLELKNTGRQLTPNAILPLMDTTLELQ